MIIDIAAPEKLPEIAEPLWLDWHAEVFTTPIMDSNEFEKAGPAIEKILTERM